jgi:hypothetical protein
MTEGSGFSPGIVRAVALVAAGFAWLGMAPAFGAGVTPGQALVIGESSYTALPPLPGCALSAHAMAAALQRLGYNVEEHDDATSGAIYAGIEALTNRMKAAPDAPAFVYVCGYATGYNDRPFVLPADAHVSAPSDVLTQGILAKSIRDAVINGKPSTVVLAFDVVPLPKVAAPVPLAALLKPAPPSAFGYIAVSDTAPGSTPMPLATTLVPLMTSPLQGAALLTAAQQQLSGDKTATVAALSLPDAGLYLAGAPPAPHVGPAAQATAPPVAAATKPAAASLPDEAAMTNPQRRLVQRALAHFGYYDGKLDGVFGPDTRAAIRRWQFEEHQPMTGHLTAQEASKLASTWD